MHWFVELQFKHVKKLFCASKIWISRHIQHMKSMVNLSKFIYYSSKQETFLLTSFFFQVLKLNIQWDMHKPNICTAYCN